MSSLAFDQHHDVLDRLHAAIEQSGRSMAELDSVAGPRGRSLFALRCRLMTGKRIAVDMVDDISAALDLPRTFLRTGAPRPPWVQDDSVTDSDTEEPPMIVSGKYTQVTPALAAKWLKQNEKNRNVVQRKVDKYAAMMAAGEWLPTNQGIGFDTNDKLVDGQHRLHAVVKSGATVTMFVSRGLSPDARWAVDSGVGRKLSHVVSMLDGETNVNNVVSWAALHARLLGMSSDLTYPQFQEWRERSKAAIDFVKDEFLAKVGGPRRTAPVAGSLVFAYPTNPEKIREFAAQLRDGENLRKHQPAHTLLQYLSTLGESRHARADMATRARKTLAAACAHVLGEPMQRVTVGDRGLAFFARYHGVTIDVRVKPRRGNDGE